MLIKEVRMLIKGGKDVDREIRMLIKGVKDFVKGR